MPPRSGVSGWDRHIYRVISLEPDADIGRKQCQAQCYFDSDECFFYVHRHPWCYLGDFRVDTDLIVDPNPETIYETNGIIYRLNFEDVVTLQFDLSRVRYIVSYMEQKQSSDNQSK